MSSKLAQEAMAAGGSIDLARKHSLHHSVVGPHRASSGPAVKQKDVCLIRK
ncbi:hypothetical protein VM1G_11756 [Cytospora mali]|uniref:Uncharacterized protein n=1 Tax=Cytospora mali TaxID=578113 RepID=A0A194W554_CYTMA|nr:hypothetical protein VM1G_11756 [Valsa mali]